jgi:hypothetical protein
MKKSFLLLGLLAVSCASDPLFKVEEKRLSSISQTTYSFDKDGNPSGNFTSVLNFENNRLNKISYDDDFYEKFEYTGELVSKRQKFDMDNQLIAITTYEYDNLGRVTKIENSEGQHKISNETSYTPNQIISVWKNAWGHVSSERYIMTLNQVGKVTQEEVRLSDDYLLYYGIYNYSSNNLKGGRIKNFSSNSDPVEDSVYFSYINKKNKYYYKKFMFGSAWEINSSIENSVNFLPISNVSWEDLLSIYPSVSDDLITGYITREVDVRYIYTFDDSGDLASQIEEREYLDGKKEKVITNYSFKASLTSAP